MRFHPRNESGRHSRRERELVARQVKFVAVSLATIRKFCTIAERESRDQATAISVSVAVPSSSRYTTP